MKVRYLRQKKAINNFRFHALREWFIEIARLTIIIQWRTPREPPTKHPRPDALLQHNAVNARRSYSSVDEDARDHIGRKHD